MYFLTVGNDNRGQGSDEGNDWLSMSLDLFERLAASRFFGGRHDAIQEL